MKHLTITDYGNFVGVRGGMCYVRDKDNREEELPLNRLRSITLTTGSAISTDLLIACAERGIKLHIVGWNGRSVAAVDGLHSHAIVKLRKAQMAVVDNSPRAAIIGAQIIAGKITNQKNLLLYFSKYHKDRPALTEAITALQLASEKLSAKKLAHFTHWREIMMGIEGRASTLYWQVLRSLELLPASFIHRDGRGATEITNQALNYGYALLLSRVWQCVTNAGLETFAGFLHTDRPGKPSLVLDIMEIFRPWIVDRQIIILRSRLSANNELTPSLKKDIARAFGEAMAKVHSFRGKKLRIETILQRQVYTLAGYFTANKPFKSFHFKW